MGRTRSSNSFEQETHTEFWYGSVFEPVTVEDQNNYGIKSLLKWI